MEDESGFEGFQICKKEVDYLHLSIENNIALPQLNLHEKCHDFNDVEKIKVEGIDIKEETEEYLNIESIDKYEYIFYQLCKQEDSDEENYFQGFITEKENDLNSHIVKSFQDCLNDNIGLSYENTSKFMNENEFKKQQSEKNTLMLVNVPSLGPIKRHRRINCGECNGCLKPNCQVCVYCIDRSTKINRLKQKCVQRKCYKFKLCGSAVCYLCGAKSLKDASHSIEDESEIIYSLMECSLCFRISHIYCQENLCNGRTGRTLTTKSNYWQCPECVPFAVEDLACVERPISRKAQCKKVFHEAIKSNKFNSKVQRKLVSKHRSKNNDKLSKVGATKKLFNVKKRKPHFECLREISFNDFKSITGRAPWNGYSVFLSMSSKMLKSQVASEGSGSFTERKGLEWKQLPERKKIVFQDGAKKINQLLLRNAKNFPKMQKSIKSKKANARKKVILESTVTLKGKNNGNIRLTNVSERRFQCPKCELIFTERYDFTLHFRAVHRNIKKRKTTV